MTMRSHHAAPLPAHLRVADTAIGGPLSPTREVDPSKQGPLLATLAAQGARVFVDLSAVASSFSPEAALKLTPSQLYDHLVAQGVPAEDARVLRAQEVDGSNFSLINDGQLERWGIAPWGRRVALVQALQALAFGPDGRPRPSDLLGNADAAYVGFDANRERATLSLNNGGLANGYGLGRDRYHPTERELLHEERERARALRAARERERGVRGYDDLDPLDGRVRHHTYVPSPVEEYRERELLRREREKELQSQAHAAARYGTAGRPRGLDRYSTYEENEPYYGSEFSRTGSSYGAEGLYSPSSRERMATLSARERQEQLEALEREREEAHLAREAARLRARGVTGRPLSAGVWRNGAGTGYGREPPYDSLRSTSYRDYPAAASSTLGGTVPLLSPLGGSGRGLDHAYSTSFAQAEADRAAAREQLARQERARLDAARYGAGLGSTLTGGYDSDEERLYMHPRRHGGYASYFKREFGRYAEPLQSGLGGAGPSSTSSWLDEFYRPADVRSARAQWSASLQPPSYTLRSNPALPEARLKLEWVYGYNSFDSRHNVMYNNVGDIVYPVASCVVVYKHRHRMQRHFQAHNDEVRALAQHPVNLNVFASGQTAAANADEHGKAPHIAVWDSTDFARVWVLPLTAADRSIRALAFSADGRYLASISNDAAHTIKLWEWETRTLLGSSRGDSYALFAIKWNHKDPAEFVTVGKSHAVFWRWDGAKLTARKAHLPGNRAVSFYSVAFSEKGYACLGADDGGIYVFVDGRLVREFKKLHKGKVLCLDWFPGGLISGGGDGVVHVLDKKLDVVRSFTFHHRVVALYARGNHLLVGTQGAQIFEIVDFVSTQVEGDTQAGIGAGQPLVPLQGGATGAEWQSPSGRIGIEPLVQGHYDGELHAIACTPGGREIVTAGEDNQLCVWEMTTHRLLRRAHLSDEPGAAPSRKHRPSGSSSSHPLHQCARALAVSPNGKFIAVGTNDGSLSIFTASDLRLVHKHDLSQYSKRTAHTASSAPGKRLHPHWIQCLKYSPNGRVLAVGTHGAIIALLDTRDNYQVKGVLSAHESFVTSVDWSDDGAFLASTDGLYHLKHHQIFENDLAQSTLVLDPSLLRDVKWERQNCVLGFAVQGVLEQGEAEGTLVAALEVSPSRAFVAAGDDAGQVQLYRFPVLAKGHQSHANHSHASHVAAVRWSLDEKYLLSVGGHDNTICQFQVVPA